jgi:UDP-N-acetylglucosamine 2-epimerase (non-hydrolysing)
MKKIKVMTVVGTRPEIIRLSRVIAALEKDTDHVLVHTGQNYDYELKDIFFKELGISKPDHYLGVAEKTAVQTMGRLFMKFEPVLVKEKPEALLILGDTNSCLASIVAKRHKVPVFHMEAGNRCFDQRVPEEINRKIVDHISDINMPYSSIAREYLLREGIPADRVIKTGSPMCEVLHFYKHRIAASKVLDVLKLQARDYFLVSCHREENVDDPVCFAQFTDLLSALSKKFGKRIIVSTHPRTRKRLMEKKVRLGKNVEFLKPFGFFDYVKLQENAYVVLSDSGTISEEASILNFPALNIRQAHERPEAMEEASVIMTGLNVERIFQGLAVLKEQGRGQSRSLRLVSDYNMPNVSLKIVRIIMSYTDYVNRVVWSRKGLNRV